MGAKSAQSLGFMQSVFGVGQNIVDMNDLAIQQYSASYTPSSWGKRQRLHVFIEL
jgi:hypothetical protein